MNRRLAALGAAALVIVGFAVWWLALRGPGEAPRSSPTAVKRDLPTLETKSQAEGGDTTPQGMAPRWEQGKRTPESLVFLFHSGVDVDPVTVSEQRETHQKWVAELPVIMPLKDDAPVSRLAA